MSAIGVLEGTRIAVTRTVYAEVVRYGSRQYEEARALQAQRFAQASASTARPMHAYHETYAFDPADTIPIVARRGCVPAPAVATTTHSPDDPVLGTLRLEVPGATAIESIVKLRPGSASERMIADGRMAEIGGLAMRSDLDKSELLDALDACAMVLLQVADTVNAEWLWLFPRRPLMSLLLAEIPDLLPPYRFTLCEGIVAWNEDSKLLQHTRELQVKNLHALSSEPPMIYQIHRDTLAEDVALRTALIDRRHERAAEIEQLLFAAMRRTHRAILADFTRLSKTFAATSASPSAASPGGSTSDARSRDDATTVPISHRRAAEGHGRQGYLPFDAPPEFKRDYLQAVITRGGAAVGEYKRVSFELLQLGEGMSVLDVGCGPAVDLLRLRDLVGEKGLVIGVDHDPDLVKAAREVVAADGRQNVLVFQGDAQHLTFPSEQFDRVRADRAMQHFTDPRRALAEMRRVLRPGGILSIVEPDWKSIALHPGSSRGGNDDQTLVRVLGRYQDRLAQGLIGRRLHALLQAQGPCAWSHASVQAVAYSVTDWSLVDAVLQLRKSAGVLAAEEPPLAAELEAWLRTVETAAAEGTFFAMIPLFYAVAQKS